MENTPLQLALHNKSMQVTRRHITCISVGVHVTRVLTCLRACLCLTLALICVYSWGTLVSTVARTCFSYEKFSDWCNDHFSCWLTLALCCCRDFPTSPTSSAGVYYRWVALYYFYWPFVTTLLVLTQRDLINSNKPEVSATFAKETNTRKTDHVILTATFT